MLFVVGCLMFGVSRLACLLCVVLPSVFFLVCCSLWVVRCVLFVGCCSLLVVLRVVCCLLTCVV